MAPVSLKVVQDVYRGTDHGNDHQPINANAGDTIEVSEEKAEQLLADFPDGFANPGRAPKPTAPAEEPTEEPAPAKPTRRKPAKPRAKRTPRTK